MRLTIDDVVSGRVTSTWYLPGHPPADRFVPLESRSCDAILSGSFNPLHSGHTRLRDAATVKLGHSVDFELAVSNADKPALSPDELASRLAQFEQVTHSAVLISRAASFLEKARIVPETTFVVGFDTAERILQVRYYDDSTEVLQSALSEIAALGCRFLVAARTTGSRLGRLSDLDVTIAPQGLFAELSESDFRLDVSSTELRKTDPDVADRV